MPNYRSRCATRRSLTKTAIHEPTSKTRFPPRIIGESTVSERMQKSVSRSRLQKYWAFSDFIFHSPGRIMTSHHRFLRSGNSGTLYERLSVGWTRRAFSLLHDKPIDRNLDVSLALGTLSTWQVTSKRQARAFLHWRWKTPALWSEPLGSRLHSQRSNIQSARPSARSTASRFVSGICLNSVATPGHDLVNL